MMQPALTLTEQERLYFMQALDAVAWAADWRNERPGSHWQAVLRQFGNLLAVSVADYGFRAGAPGIAEKVNQIGNPRARLYFLRIVHDVYWVDFTSLGEGIFSDANKRACRERYKPFYKQLCDAIRLD